MGVVFFKRYFFLFLKTYRFKTATVQFSVILDVGGMVPGLYKKMKMKGEGRFSVL